MSYSYEGTCENWWDNLNYRPFCLECNPFKGDTLITNSDDTQDSDIKSAREHEKKVEVLISIAYAFFSSTLLLVNKWAVNEFPFLNIVLTLQFCSSTIASFVMMGAKFRTPDKRELALFVPCVLIFFATLVTNFVSLKYLGVDIVILLRVLATFFVAAGDWLFNRRKIPSPNSMLCLVSITVASFFVFSLNTNILSFVGVCFGIGYVICFTIDQVFLKWFTDHLFFETTERMMWTNLFSIPVALIAAIVNGELWNLISTHKTEPKDLLPVILSCFLGVGLSYFSWDARKRLSALSFTLIGVLCKIVSIILNMIFFAHLQVISILLISCGIFSTLFYKQAEHRDVNSTSFYQVDKNEDVSKTSPRNIIPWLILMSIIFVTLFSTDFGTISGIGESVVSCKPNTIPLLSSNSSSEIQEIQNSSINYINNSIYQKNSNYVNNSINKTTISKFKHTRSRSSSTRHLLQLYSWHQCVGSMPIDESFKYRSCHFKRVCYDGNEENIVTYHASNNERIQYADEITTSTMEIAFDSIMKPYTPKIVRKPWLIEANGRNITWVNSTVVTVLSDFWRAGCWGHLLMDNFFPMFRLMKIFGLSEDETSLNPLSINPVCDPKNCGWLQGPYFSPDWISLFTKRNELKKFREFYEVELRNDGIVCFENFFTGLSFLSDHGLDTSVHGRNKKSPEWPAFGIGNLYWEFRGYTMKLANLLPEKTDEIKRDLVILQRGKKANFVGTVNYDEIMEKLFQKLPKIENTTSEISLELLSPKEQMQFMSESKVVLSISGQTAFGGLWLPRGGSLIVIMRERDEMLDITLLKNLGYINVEYFNIGEDDKIVSAVISALERFDSSL